MTLPLFHQIGLHAWTWSTIFHSRDFPFTEVSLVHVIIYILADLLCLFGFLTVQNLQDSVDIKSFVDTYSYLYGDYQIWIRTKYIIHFVFIWHSHSVNRAFTVHFALAFSLCVRSSLNKFRSASTHRLLRVRSPFAQRALTIQ